MPKRIDITGQVFGDLKVIKLSDQKNKYNTLLWECQCKCGKLIYVLATSLRAGHYKSCGCVHAEKRDHGIKEHIRRDRVAGTRKSALKAKLHKANKSGIKGVYWDESRKKWNVHIGFRGKSINLGYYSDKNEAAAARKAAEEKYHKPILEQDKNYISE